jgi:hypothetical protein
MKKNIGKLDRMARIVIALIIGILYATNIITGTLAIVLMILAVVFISTSIFSFCPLYLPFGIKTNKDETINTL